MYEGRTVGIVIPAYNEEGFVGRVIETAPPYVDRIYAIDDGSSDGTWDEIRRAAARKNRVVGQAISADGGSATLDRQVVALRHPTNRGVGASIKLGYERALSDGLDVVAVMNGDGQMDPEALTLLLDPLAEGEAEFAKGNRLRSPDHREGMSRWRLFGNALLSFLTKVASGYWKTMDPQNGYTAISRSALLRLPLSDLYDRYGFCNDLLVKLNACEAEVADVSIPAVYGEESSTIRYSTFVPGLSVLLVRNFWWRLTRRYLVLDFHPLVFGYAIGLFATVVGAVATLRSVLGPDRGDSRLVSLLLAVVGALSVVAAMVLDMRENERLETRIDGAEGRVDGVER
ncbi:glycosyltransferase family 2 protein [Natronorarus salvus]|uniref:glycosyltransferase family 2 protein n=1 Tax=Natronorarus salvus TaxID=3117733 RepID=UPI002F26CE17